MQFGYVFYYGKAQAHALWVLRMVRQKDYLLLALRHSKNLAYLPHFILEKLSQGFKKL